MKWPNLDVSYLNSFNAFMKHRADNVAFAPALSTYIAPLLLSSTEIPTDVQPSRARLLSIPDYFTNFKGVSNDEAPFLGACLVAKVCVLFLSWICNWECEADYVQIAFTEYAGKHYITKVDYNAKGPAAIYTVVGDN